MTLTSCSRVPFCHCLILFYGATLTLTLNSVPAPPSPRKLILINSVPSRIPRADQLSKAEMPRRRVDCESRDVTGLPLQPHSVIACTKQSQGGPSFGLTLDMSRGLRSYDSDVGFGVESPGSSVSCLSFNGCSSWTCTWCFFGIRRPRLGPMSAAREDSDSAPCWVGELWSEHKTSLKSIAEVAPCESR